VNGVIEETDDRIRIFWLKFPNRKRHIFVGQRSP
jgi:hypothetical protein